MDEQIDASEDLAPRAAPAQERSEHHIEAQASLTERSLRTLKDGDSFAVLDTHGDIGGAPERPEGLFHRDTRHLSRLELRMSGKRPLLLSSTIQDDNAALTVDLANPDFHGGPDGLQLARDVIAFDRTQFIWNAVFYERLGIRNFGARACRFRIDLWFDADFRDLFEVRGMTRLRCGRIVREIRDGRVLYTYHGLDGVLRRTTIAFDRAPSRLLATHASFEIDLAPGARSSLLMAIGCANGDSVETLDAIPAARVDPACFVISYRDNRRGLRALTADIASVATSNALFNEIAHRSASDVYTLISRTEHGMYPYAGIPWYSTVFGRDGVITAMLMLWVDPEIARGVLRYLASCQATAFDKAADAEPGKIVHERRSGEMANLGEVPFKLYYGAVDATPLYVWLAGCYFDRTGDLDTIRAIWPNIEAALRWCDEHGDRDGDGFLEYYRETPQGLANQGWKDSPDSIFHADGRDARGPIALVEVQAYLYAARRAAATLAGALGAPDRARALERQAEDLRQRFEEAFWCDELGTYALALDGEKQPCRVRASNAGHALFAGVASPARARRVAEGLMSEAGFSGWGIRTLARGQPRYNPMSYHNGSVWPHDNAMIALGFARYGMKAQAVRVFEGVFSAATHQELRRLPELFCGFLRKRRRGPTAYPVACSPQAWAAATPFALLRACLGLDLPAGENEIRLIDPILPDFLDDVTIRRLRIGSSRFDLRVHRHGRDVTVNVLERWRGSNAKVVLVKSAL